MIARLGEVLFWAGCIVAALIIAAGGLLFSNTYGADRWFYATLTAIAAAVAFLTGRAARYVLAAK